MSLSGTFETLPLTGVLGLLASSKKTGALRLDTDGAAAVVYMREGLCCGAEGGRHTGPCADERALETRLLDVCFEVARQDGGTFAFDQGSEPEFDAPHTLDVSGAVIELEEQLEQWATIREVITSLEHQPRLNATLAVDTIDFDRDRWKLLVLVDGRRTVRQIVDKLEGSLIDVCRELVTLVEEGAVAMSKKARSASFADVDTDESADNGSRPGLIVPSKPYGPGVDDADPDSDVMDAAPVAPASRASKSKRARVSHDGSHESDEMSVDMTVELPVADSAESHVDDAVDDDASVLAHLGDYVGSGSNAEHDDDELSEHDDAGFGFGGPSDGDEDRGDAEDVAAAVQALKDRGELPPDASPDEVRDRGALLRLFSALRDS